MRHNGQALAISRPHGMYCGPLRLLAVEVHSRLNKDGLPCSLVTGQERVSVPGAVHVACTTEMASTQNMVELAVIDEIQVRVS
jgi:ATP-dependent RNA helicase SUPV3L1/SUV3